MVTKFIVAKKEKRMTIKILFAAFALVAAGLTASVAQAHAKMESSQPKANSELPDAPKEIRLRFNENLEPAFSKIELANDKGVAVALPKVDIDKTDHKVMFAAVPPLQKGQYQVRWSAMTFDGHKTKGQFTFRIK